MGEITNDNVSEFFEIYSNYRSAFDEAFLEYQDRIKVRLNKVESLYYNERATTIEFRLVTGSIRWIFRTFDEYQYVKQIIDNIIPNIKIKTYVEAIVETPKAFDDVKKDLNEHINELDTYAHE